MRAFNAVVTNRIPQFIKDDYPAFAEFIEAYYEWLKLNQIEPADFKSIRDIDTTLDQYLDYFRTTLAKGIPSTTAGDMRTIIKNIRQLFKSKGTEKSIKFFFRAFFNESVEITYPRNQMFIPSDSTWIRNRTIKIFGNQDTISKVKGKILTFGDGQLYVADAYLSGSLVILSVSDIVGNIESVSSLKLEETNEYFTISKQVIGIKVINPGSNFTPGTVYNLSHGVSINIKETTRGRIESLNILDGGTDYNGTEDVVFTLNGPYGKTDGKGAIATIDSVDINGTITGITLINGGTLYSLPPGVFIETSGISAVIEAVGNFGGIKQVSIIDGGSNVPLAPWQETINDSTFEVILGNVCEQEGYFYNTIGIPSSTTSYLQDEHYYQYFSYVVKTGINLSQYASLLKKLIHPAGMKMFSTFTIQETLQIISKVAPSFMTIELFSEIQQSATFRETIWTLFINTKSPSIGTRHKEIDVHKYAWFDESSKIHRFSDLIIQDYCFESDVNPLSNSVTNIQPDLVVKLLNMASISGFGDSLGSNVIGNTSIG